MGIFDQDYGASLHRRQPLPPGQSAGRLLGSVSRNYEATRQEDLSISERQNFLDKVKIRNESIEKLTGQKLSIDVGDPSLPGFTTLECARRAHTRRAWRNPEFLQRAGAVLSPLSVDAIHDRHTAEQSRGALAVWYQRRNMRDQHLKSRYLRADSNPKTGGSKRTIRVPESLIEALLTLPSYSLDVGRVFLNKFGGVLAPSEWAKDLLGARAQSARQPA
jgi:hypothetical protein